MSATAYTPGLGGLPFGNTNTNPQASQYAPISAFSPTESILIAKAIKRAIFDAAPEQYNALKLVFEKEFEDVNNDEFEYLENTFGRSPLEADAVVAAVAAVANTVQTATYTLTAASMNFLTPDLVIVFPDNSHGVIESVNIGANQITVNSLTGEALPAVAVGDIFSIQSTVEADGMDYFSNYERLDTVTRYNFVQLFLRACRWNRVELQKYINSGTTDYLAKDKMHKIRQIRIDVFNTFFNGQRGEFSISNGNVAKATGGIFPTMVSAGSMNANPTVAGLQAAFEALAFATNFKKEGATRFMFGTDEILYEFSKIYKQPGLRYTPSDTIANLNLKKIEIGTMNIVLVPCELFREISCFPADFRRRLFVLDLETIQPVKIKGLPAFEMDQTTLNRGVNGTREDFTDFYVRGQMGLRFHNPLASFWIDVQ